MLMHAPQVTAPHVGLQVDHHNGTHAVGYDQVTSLVIRSLADLQHQDQHDHMCAGRMQTPRRGISRCNKLRSRRNSWAEVTGDVVVCKQTHASMIATQECCRKMLQTV